MVPSDGGSDDECEYSCNCVTYLLILWGGSADHIYIDVAHLLRKNRFPRPHSISFKKVCCLVGTYRVKSISSLTLKI